MHRLSILALGFGTLLAACLLGTGCGGDTNSGTGAPNGGQGTAARLGRWLGAKRVFC
jgi:hypothetical protein